MFYPLGVAEVTSKGSDITLVGWGRPDASASSGRENGR